MERYVYYTTISRYVYRVIEMIGKLKELSVFNENLMSSEPSLEER